jgi:hypothetical protein
MTSFAVNLEPAASPRLAFLALAIHVAAAASPWIAGVPAWLAIPLTAAALAGLASSLAAVPGPHHRIAALRIDGAGCRVRLRGSRSWQPATIGPGSAALRGIAFLDIRAAGGRMAWLLTPSAAPAESFRSLKARLRLSC